jgi:hypothetical protein
VNRAWARFLLGVGAVVLAGMAAYLVRSHSAIPGTQASAFCEGSGPLRAGNVYEQTKDGCLALIGRSTTE